MTRDAWLTMRSGAVDDGLREMREAFLEKGTPSHIMQLGVAYMWVKDYPSARDHFERANRKYPKHNSVFYGFEGVANWCLGAPELAVARWRTGLECDFADPAGGIRSPLLLYMASVLMPAVISHSEAEELLRDRMGVSRPNMWPGPLCCYVLGRLDEEELRKSCIYPRSDEVTRVYNWEADFYIGVCGMAHGDGSRLDHILRSATELSWELFDSHRKAFLGLLWREEFHIARFEANRKLAWHEPRRSGTAIEAKWRAFNVNVVRSQTEAPGVPDES